MSSRYDAHLQRAFDGEQERINAAREFYDDPVPETTTPEPPPETVVEAAARVIASVIYGDGGHPLSRATDSAQALAAAGLLRDDDETEVEKWRVAYDGLLDERDELRAKVERLTYLLGSHADGHRCTCTRVAEAVYHGDNMHPEEWEQDPWCPTHPDMEYVLSAKAALERVEALADEWERDARAIAGPSAARTFAFRLRKALRGES